MGFLNHRKKNKEPKRVEKYGLLFCLEGNYTKIIDQIEMLFNSKSDEETNVSETDSIEKKTVRQIIIPCIMVIWRLFLFLD